MSPGPRVGEGPEGAPAGRVEGLFIAASLRDRPEACGALELVAGRGVRRHPDGPWDRYAVGPTGAPVAKSSYGHRPEPGRQCTVVSRAGCEAAGLAPEASRRNVAVSLSAELLNEAVGRELRLGEDAVLFVHRKCVPCKPLEKRSASPGLVEAFWDRAGLSCEIVAGGVVREGDPVSIDFASAPDQERVRAPGWTHEMLNVPPSRRGKKNGPLPGSALLTVLALSCCVLLQVACCEAKRVGVLGGMMKSHHISMRPIVEGLLERGHDVTFLLPNTTDARGYFPNGISAGNRSAALLFLGQTDWSFDDLFAGDDIDLKNKPWLSVGPNSKVRAFAHIFAQIRTKLALPMFGMLDDLKDHIGPSSLHGGGNYDLFLMHMASFGLFHAVEDGGINVVTVQTTPPTPFLNAAVDNAHLVRLPNQLSPPRTEELRTSFAARVKNQALNRFLQLYMAIMNHILRLTFLEHGLVLEPGGVIELMQSVPNSIVLGGPPLSVPMPLTAGTHVLGFLAHPERAGGPSLRSTTPLGAWLDAASGPVIYISLGTKYEFTETTAAQVVGALGDLLGEVEGLRVLWSLRAAQQAKLQQQLEPLAVHGAAVRLERWTPQPAVLNHAAVRVFLSHCGFGGVTDTLLAGKPVLAYPGIAEQFLNANALADAGAALVVDNDFANLVEAASEMLAEGAAADGGAFVRNAAAVREQLLGYGGFARAMEIFEAAAEGRHLEPAAVPTKDDFFDRPQAAEELAVAVLAAAAAAAALGGAGFGAWIAARCLRGLVGLLFGGRGAEAKVKAA